jgi:LmbE family N-acetylglucosaminyl deacetylase
MRFFTVLFVLLGFSLAAQQPTINSSADIEAGLHRLSHTTTVLYVAAHPDDENTNLISYFSNNLHYNTYYLSLTRGDGGQNLLGAEIRDDLGVLRTEELMAARRIDGGNQLFSRANDFGYSKTPEETLTKWDRQAVLADIVWAIRKTRPDIVINRFWHGTERPNHGHHTASAQLALEAFDLAGDPKAFPEQLKYVQVWQPKRILCNISSWFYGGQEAFEKIDKSKFISFDIGVYYPQKGIGNRELAALSRSQHQCQAMGTIGQRGTSIEYFEHLKGEAPVGNDLFSGINTSWSKVSGGQEIANLLDIALRTFDHNKPEESLLILLQTHRAIQRLPQSDIKNRKLDECNNLIIAALGLYAEASATDFSGTPGETTTVQFELTRRTNVDITVKQLSMTGVTKDSTLNLALPLNKSVKWSSQVTIPTNATTSAPYWLAEGSGNQSMYTVSDQTLIGLPRTPRPLKAQFTLEIGGETVPLTIDVSHKWEDPARGERWRPFDILPPVTLGFDRQAYVFNGTEPQQVTIQVRAGQSKSTTEIALSFDGKGWKSEPTSIPVQFTSEGETKTLHFTVTPSNNAEATQIKGIATMNGVAYSQDLKFIEYPHVPVQPIMHPTSAKVVPIVFSRKGQRIGYIVGAGDDVPRSLQYVGYDVDLLTEKDMEPEVLATYDAILIGIRACNTEAWIKYAQPALFDYAKNGGALIVQYQTNYDLLVDSLLPVSMKLTRGRVTDENSPTTFLQPKHPALTTPNAIEKADFDGWVQERGIYFAGNLDPAYVAPIGLKDPNEDEQNGSLVIAPYGQGFVAYTGLAFFRQLPAGVPGSYKLMANLIGLGKGAVVGMPGKKGKKKRGV